MSRRMVWMEDDHCAGWSCSQCSWLLSPLRLDTTVAALAYNRTAQGAFDRHDCIASKQTGKARAQTAGL
jgi:hypothetical protein